MKHVGEELRGVPVQGRGISAGGCEHGRSMAHGQGDLTLRSALRSRKPEKKPLCELPPCSPARSAASSLGSLELTFN